MVIDAVSLDSYYQLMRSLSDGDMDKFKMHLSKYIMQSGSFFDFDKNTSEQVFHVFILGLIVGLRDHYIIQSNHEAGLGRSDVMMIPKNKQMQGIILEFKTGDVSELLRKAEEALQQIKDKKYVESFHQHNISSVLLIGLSFSGKQMEFVHETIEV